MTNFLVFRFKLYRRIIRAKLLSSFKVWDSIRPAFNLLLLLKQAKMAKGLITYREAGYKTLRMITAHPMFVNTLVCFWCFTINFQSFKHLIYYLMLECASLLLNRLNLKNFLNWLIWKTKYELTVSWSGNFFWSGNFSIS